MSYKQNLHTHTIYCDGKNTPEEMVIAAIEQGFDSIGFSGHSFVDVLYDFAMDEQKSTEYRKDVLSLREKYAGKIDILCGLELDYNSPMDTASYDYIIGSVHCMQKNGEYLFVDWDTDKVRHSVEDVFAGDGIEYAKFYFGEVAKLADVKNVDIIAHFDLLTKFCERVTYFDQNSEAYIRCATDAMDALEGKVPFFEVNTGAIGRGYRTSPYPSETLIKEFKKRNFGAVITTDCHNKDFLSCGYEDAKILLAKCGFTHHNILTKDGFKAIPLFD